jgi:hypothetical protein
VVTNASKMLVILSLGMPFPESDTLTSTVPDSGF